MSTSRRSTRSRTRGGSSTSSSSTRSRRGRRRGRGRRSNPITTSPSGRRKRITERRFDRHKVANPFGHSRKKTKTAFGSSYDCGDIPCRISHGGGMTHLSLRWDTEPDAISFNPTLLHFAEGLRETDHPYVVLSTLGFRDLLQSDGAHEKLQESGLLGQVVRYIRLALMQAGSFSNGLDAVAVLVRCVQEDIVPHLNALLVQLNKKAFDKRFAGKIMEVLQGIEECAGEEATPLIKAKVPTYCSVFL